ncbi:hypothetical protein F4821DRAFT_264195 [Hypoxylon rubiginosum]|uniref:Uncharacterized protein n=1 Tax=Hypoxylon rubiginosum TaxID=110542 RepID=A0ACC0CPB4_9PEZI|nr:hypothetical protein F4821DRAFT_264195 [Hypoxylon rubiginosum]
MCRNVHLEICCDDQDLHPFYSAFPYTIRAVNIIALCQERLQDIAENGSSDIEDEYDVADQYMAMMRREKHGTHKSRSRGSTNLSGPPRPHNRAKPCPYYRPNYVRNERIYFSKCDDCVRAKGALVKGFTEDDLQINLEYNNCLLEDIMNGVRQKEYFQLVRDWFFEYEIRRYICVGVKWYIIGPPPPGSLTLRPDPDPEDPEYAEYFDYNLTPSLYYITDQMLGEVGRQYWNFNPFADRIYNWMDGVNPVGQVIPTQQAAPTQTISQGQAMFPDQAEFSDITMLLNDPVLPESAVSSSNAAIPNNDVIPGQEFLPVEDFSLDDILAEMDLGE